MDVTSTASSNHLNKTSQQTNSTSQQNEQSVQAANKVNTDQVTLSDEAIAAANNDAATQETEPDVTPFHAGGGVYVPPPTDKPE